jgi:hypothetical protein
MVPKFAHFTTDTLKLGMKLGICGQTRAQRRDDFKGNSIELHWTFLHQIMTFLKLCVLKIRIQYFVRGGGGGGEIQVLTKNLRQSAQVSFSRQGESFF